MENEKEDWTYSNPGSKTKCSHCGHGMQAGVCQWCGYPNEESHKQRVRQIAAMLDLF